VGARRIAAHVEAAADQAAASPAAAALFHNLGLYLMGRAEYTAAQQALERAPTIEEAAYGPNHPDTRTARRGLEELAERQTTLGCLMDGGKPRHSGLGG
jgi:uncharacterized protein HemY